MVSRSVQKAAEVSRRSIKVRNLLMVLTSFFRFFELPAEIVVVNHLFGHAAINADVLARDEARLVRGEEENHVRDVERIADATSEVLRGVRPGIGLERGVDPARRDRIDSYMPGQARGKRVREGGDAAFGRGVALRLRLAHPVS